MQGSKPDSDSLRLDRLILEAAALDTEQRTAYFRRLTSEDPEILDRARRLLDAADQISESFLATFSPSGSEAPSSGPPVQPLDLSGTTTERYRVDRRLGSGGMATVYSAHDLQLDRPVALKVLHHNAPETIERCLREARAQARLRHPNVLEVYESGELENGHPFIAMRFVEGCPISELDDLSLEQRVLLLIQVAEGLDAAHQLGLVHRDVKPSNILVESAANGELHAWVADFGIASLLQHKESGHKKSGHSEQPVTSLLTDGALVGTAHYLAPERLKGPEEAPSSPSSALIDRRVDVFSLGVTLYQTLTGTLPFVGDSLFEVLHHIRHQPTPSLRARAPHLPSDLEAIVLKCLAKDPDERYPSARAVAEDLRRFARGEVVDAHAAGLAYRLTKTVLRHRSLFLLGSVAAVLLAVSLTVTALFGWQAMQANDQATARRHQAEKLVTFMLLNLRDKLDSLGRLELLEDVGAQAMDYFASVPESELSDEELARRATALYQIGDLRLRQGRLDAASEAFVSSLELAEVSAQRDPQRAERLFELGQSEFWVGHVRWKQGNNIGAIPHFVRYLEISQDLNKRDPEHLDWQLELAYAHSNLGTVFRDMNELERSVEHYRKSLDIRRDLVKADPEDAKYRRRLALAHNALAVVLEDLGRLDEARSHFESSIQESHRLVERHPGHAYYRDDLAVAHNYLGGLDLRTGLTERAHSHFERAEAIYNQLLRDDTHNAHWQFRRAMNLNSLGRALIQLRSFDSGLSTLHEQRRILERLVERPSAAAGWQRELAGAHLHLAIAGLQTGELDRASEHLDIARRMLVQRIENAEDDLEAIRRLSFVNLVSGDLHERRGNEVSARESWTRAVTNLDQAVINSRDHYVLGPWAAALVRLGRQDRAAGAIEKLRKSGNCSPYFHHLCRPSAEARSML